MTGTASNRGKLFMDFDSNKNQEWLRRRKLRLEQVRKQSNEIAKVLRQKVNEEERKRLEEYERMREEKFQMWKAERLEELGIKLKCALEGFGSGYLMAELDPDQELVLEERNKHNFSKAQERGEIAYQEELRRKKLAMEKVTSAVERKKMTRKKEDLRSALVRTIPVKKQLIEVQEYFEDEGQPASQKVTLMKKKIKKINEKQNPPAVEKKAHVKSKKKKKGNHKSCKSKSKATDFGTYLPEKGDTVWINLDEMGSSEGSSRQCFTSNKSTTDSKKSQKEKSEGSVEFYDFSSRYYCKSFREFPHLVERIDHDSEELNAHQLAKIEEKDNRAEMKKKAEVDAVSQNRGLEALKKERINRDYNNLMSKLKELSKKEKILKAQTQDHPNFLHMNDERLFEKTKARQKIMESKFESVYFDAVARIPQAGLPGLEPQLNLSGGGDYVQSDDRPTTSLSFSASNLRHNSPASSSERSSSNASTLEPRGEEAKEKDRSQRQLLSNINRTLREGRELRKTISGKLGTKSSEEELQDEEEQMEKKKEAEEAEVLHIGGETTLTKCQESQTDEVKVFEGREVFCKGGDESLPGSTSTTYKSPPSVIRCHKLNQFLGCLEGLRETRENCEMKRNSRIREKVNGMLDDLLHEEGENMSEQQNKTSQVNRTLEYYIEKLLSMSRDSIANLSISSENVSTPNITDLDSEHLSRPSSCGDDLVRKSRLERADALEKSIRNWKMILGKHSTQETSPDDKLFLSEKSEKKFEGDDLVNGLRMEGVELVKGKSEEPLLLCCSHEVGSKYDLITKKCSERISELSEMLEKVRKDKDKLLGSASGSSNVSRTKDGRCSVKGLYLEEEVVPVQRSSASMPKNFPVLESFLNRYKLTNLTRVKEDTVSTTAVADSQSIEDANESLESWPDVMDELLKREILTSPFKWSEGNVSSELTVLEQSLRKPSSIECVIGNFRREIDKIKKPSVLTEENVFCQGESDILECREATLRWMRDNGPQNLLSSPTGRVLAQNDLPFREESSVESINHYLTSLGLNWAKSFLRKDAESRARTWSSNSERKSSGEEEDS